ncbi:O-antigen ligase family protein [Bosea lathyri]|nr:O-antigen ligase family protein [Bosea lathyri]
MSSSPLSRQILRAGSAPASWSGRLTTLGYALLAALPLAMWIANRSAPLVLGMAAAAFTAASVMADGWRAPLRRLLDILRSPVGFAICAFLLWSLVTLAWSHRPAQGLRMWGELVLPLLFGLAITASDRFRPGVTLSRALALSLVAASVLIMVELGSGLSQRIMLGVGKQYGFVFNRPALTCLFLAGAVLPGLWSHVGPNRHVGANRRDRLLAWLSTGLVVVAVIAMIFASDSGAAKLGLAILIAVWVVAQLLPRLALWAVMLGFVLTMALSPVIGRLADAAFPPSLYTELQEAHSRERVDIWLSFGEAIRARPLLGSGFGTSAALDSHPVALAVSEAHRPMLAVGHPHSAPIQAWVETGAPGAAVLAFAGVACLWRLRRLPASRLAPRLALFASAFGVASVAHGAWQGWWIAALTVAALWLYAALPEPGGE